MAGARLDQCLHGTAKLLTEVEAAGSKRCNQCPREAAKLPTEVVEVHPVYLNIKQRKIEGKKRYLYPLN